MKVQISAYLRVGKPKDLHVIQVPALAKDKDRKDANVNDVKKGCWMFSLL